MHNAMDTLLALKCGTCGGSKEIQVHVSRDINSPTQPQPCCGCLNLDDIPTGLLVPELVEQCTGMMDEWDEEDYEIEGEEYYTSGDSVATRYYNIGPVKICKETPCTKDEQCFQCGGTGLVPVSEDTALRVALEWLTKFSEEAVLITSGITPSGNCWSIGIAELDTPTLGATPLEAIAAAIKASVEVAGA